MTEESHKDDLPLLANVDDITVVHYILHLTCDFQNKCFSGTLTLCLQPTIRDKSVPCQCVSSHGHLFRCHISKEYDHYHPLLDHDYCSCAYVESESNTSVIKEMDNNDTTSPFKFILDTCDIIVDHVEEIENLPSKLMCSDVFEDYCATSKNVRACPLHFFTDEWSLKIWKDDIYCATHFPSIVRIHYKTTANGHSLLWVKDQDGKNCVFTYGAWINNRSLFPCQEAPTAMATWEAVISTVEEWATVLMSGDNAALIQNCECGHVHHYYSTKMVLPLSTLSLAVGFWQGKEACMCDSPVIHDASVVPCRIFAPALLISKAEQELSPHMYRFLKGAEQLLTKYPFSRLDVLIVPRCFGSLGMANPNIIFLSQSVLCGDGSMCIRLAHEIAHTWFGLLIGAYDWTEEWISEGFATFLEDKIFSLSLKGVKDFEADLLELRSYIRWRMLKAESSTIEDDLQILRPTHGKGSTKEEVDGSRVTYLKNGQKDDKKFIQMHYLKGYFFLHYLSNLTGEKKFMEFLRQYVSAYQGKLVLSKEFLDCFWNSFPEIRQNSLTLEDVILEWLDTPGLPNVLRNYVPSKSNVLYSCILCEASKWNDLNNVLKKTKKKKGVCLQFKDIHFRELVSEQLVLLLEILLEENSISHVLLEKLLHVYGLESRNADVQHRWCELIVKHKYRPGYSHVKYFLIEHQAMGVYLFGELMISKVSAQQKLAKECFAIIKDEMEPPSRNVVMEMLGISRDK